VKKGMLWCCWLLLLQRPACWWRRDAGLHVYDYRGRREREIEREKGVDVREEKERREGLVRRERHIYIYKENRHTHTHNTLRLFATEGKREIERVKERKRE